MKDPAVVVAFTIMGLAVVAVIIGAIVLSRQYSRDLDAMTRLTQASMRDIGRYMFPPGREENQ